MPRLFALDHNFPDPIVAAAFACGCGMLVAWLAHA
jgi:hypothetical protein